MSQTSMTDRQREQVRRLARLSSELAAGLTENQQRLHEQLAAADQQCTSLIAHLEQQATQALGDLEGEYNRHLEAARLDFERQVASLEELRANRSNLLAQQRARAIAAAVADFEATDLRLRDRRIHEADQLERRHQEFLEKCQACREQLQQLEEQLEYQLSRRGVALAVQPAPAADRSEGAWSSMLIRNFDAHAERLGLLLTRARRSRAHRYLEEGWSVLLLLAAAGAGILPCGMLTGRAPLPWAASVLASSVLVTILVHQLTHRAAARFFRQLAPDISGELSAATDTVEQAAKASQREAKTGLQELQRQCSEQAARAAHQRQQQTAQAEAEFQRQTQQLEQAYTQQLAALEQTWEQHADRTRTHYRPLLEERRAFFAKQRQQTLQEAVAARERAEQQFQRERQELHDRWGEAIQRFTDFTEDVERACAPIVADQSEAARTAWQPPTLPPRAVPLGRYQLTLPAEPGHSRDEAARVPVPALLSFPQDGSLLLKASGPGRDAAVRILQNATLRLLTSFPPGKLRLTIVDPLGLGQTFSAFMHMADYDERLVSSRIWTEATHINQRLTDLTEHMENVIQKYLRNEFQSIQEYNERAGEVAEPFRVLVIADYPHQFSDEATRRLASIAASGPRCGVYVLMSVDMEAKLPQGAPWDDLQRNAQVFRWEQGRFVDEQAPLADLPLTFDPPPDDQTLTQIVKLVGHHAQDTRRVQVPFDTIMPADKAVWTHDCAEQLTVPLGRSGATQIQSLQLGQGTAQHVLIAGKTGSGKSTLLHALVTSAALRYSPDQLQFYLIDFKKGVEFKAYAEYQLPHARVIAIESEREFGLSVLRRLDHELRRRGDLLRDTGVQSLAAYRKRHPHQPLPRLLLIVDEFQEFFVNDDKLAHEASLLLDRLVRQGRAFGMHVILGSQTLAGAYSLARSTIGQMAVRIALECSAGDAHLILSEDNTAARLLGRPGEAIYNDANGRFEGNHPFQVVWLSDDQRNERLGQIRQRAVDAGRVDDPPIVFEGHAAAELAGNSDLRRLVDVGPSLDASPAPRAWLGAAIEIKEPTAVVFRRQGGANLMIVGHSRELARGLLASSVISLAATHLRAEPDQPARHASFWVLDGERAEQPRTAFADTLQPYLNVPLHIVGPAEAERTIERLAELVEQRLAAPELHQESVYLVIHDLARFRQLQPTTDEFGLGRFGDADSASTAARFGRILRDGPPLGVHTLVWADCYHTVSRWFDRQALRDFGHRVLLQMSGVDSSHLMDSTAASQLGSYRALLCDHDLGQAEKFRPYALPSATWLGQLQQRLASPPDASSDSDHGPATSDAETLV